MPHQGHGLVDPGRRRIRRGAIAVVESGERLLMIRRAPGIPLGGTWCFPGGHVEPGENARRAIIRECREELGLEVVPQYRLGSIRAVGGTYVLVTWLVQVPDPLPTLCPAVGEIADLRWVAIRQVDDIKPGLPSNSEVIHLLRRYRTSGAGRKR